MTADDQARDTKFTGLHFQMGPSLIWGFFLIALGGAFMLDRFGVVHVPSFDHFWPIVLVVIAISNVAEKRPGSAVMFLVLAAWFFAVQFHWRGFTYGNSWPLAMVAVGAGIVVSAVTGEDEARRIRIQVRRKEAHHD